MIIFIPKKKSTLFNLYAYSIILNKEFVENTGTYLHTTDYAVLFYKYPTYRRAYVVKKHTETSAVRGVYLPGINEQVDIIYMATGRRVDLLKTVVFTMKKKYSNRIFMMPEEFWIKVTSLLDHFNGKQSFATPLRCSMLYRQYELITRRKQCCKSL